MKKMKKSQKNVQKNSKKKFSPSSLGDFSQDYKVQNFIKNPKLTTKSRQGQIVKTR